MILITKQKDLGQIYVRTCCVQNGYRKGHVDVLCNYFVIGGFMLQWDRPAPGRVLNGARCIAVTDDSFPVLATTPHPVKHKLRPCAVHGKGSWCLFCCAARLSSTRCACPQLAHYSINTKAVTDSVSPCFVSHTSRFNINLALKSCPSATMPTTDPYMNGLWISPRPPQSEAGS